MGVDRISRSLTISDWTRIRKHGNDDSRITTGLYPVFFNPNIGDSKMAISFNNTSASRGHKVIMSREDVESLLDNSTDNSKLRFTIQSKTRGESKIRFSKYSKAQTIKQYLELNSDTPYQKNDLIYDLMRGIAVIEK